MITTIRLLPSSRAQKASPVAAVCRIILQRRPAGQAELGVRFEVWSHSNGKPELLAAEQSRISYESGYEELQVVFPQSKQKPGEIQIVVDPLSGAPSPGLLLRVESIRLVQK